MKKVVNHFDKALQHVRDNKTWSDAQEALALERISHYRCGIDFADSEISNKINDLMEEYGEDNDLAEGWWLLYGDTDDVFFKL
jgi:hypothetical protein